MPDLLHMPERRVAGISTRTTNAKEAHPDTASIPALWSSFFSDGIQQRLPDRKQTGELLGVYTDYESGRDGAYTLIAAEEVGLLDRVPEGLVTHTVPPGNYLVFRRTGRLPQVAIDAWNDVWRYFDDDPDYSRSYTTDYEVYESEDSISIHIAVEPTMTTSTTL